MEKFAKTIQKIQILLGGISISIFFLAIILQIFARYTKFTAVWTGEVSTYSFIWAVMMGAGAMMHEKKHFAFELLINKLKGKNKLYLEMFISFMVFGFSVALFYYGALITKQFWNYVLIDLPMVKKGYMFMVLPILGFTMIIYSLDHFAQYFKRLKKGGEEC